MQRQSAQVVIGVDGVLCHLSSPATHYRQIGVDRGWIVEIRLGRVIEVSPRADPAEGTSIQSEIEEGRPGAAAVGSSRQRLLCQNSAAWRIAVLLVAAPGFHKLAMFPRLAKALAPARSFPEWVIDEYVLVIGAHNYDKVRAIEGILSRNARIDLG